MLCGGAAPRFSPVGKTWCAPIRSDASLEVSKTGTLLSALSTPGTTIAGHSSSTVHTAVYRALVGVSIGQAGAWAGEGASKGRQDRRVACGLAAAYLYYGRVTALRHVSAPSKNNQFCSKIRRSEWLSAPSMYILSWVARRTNVMKTHRSAAKHVGQVTCPR